MLVKFYMKGGHVIYADQVKHISMAHDTTTGAYCGYDIAWEDEGGPKFFSLSIPDIVAVVSVND